MWRKTHDTFVVHVYLCACMGMCVYICVCVIMHVGLTVERQNTPFVLWGALHPQQAPDNNYRKHLIVLAEKVDCKKTIIVLIVPTKDRARDILYLIEHQQATITRPSLSDDIYIYYIFCTRKNNKYAATNKTFVS